MMPDHPRFTVRLVIEDRFGTDAPAQWAVPCDEALHISSRAVDEMKAGLSGSPDNTVSLMRSRDLRRSTLVKIAKNLANQMADRMEDAEGWHDLDRQDRASESLGGYRP
jgi:hypothetical protein